jgi:transposase
MPIAASFSKPCPSCGSEKTEYVQQSTLGKLKILVTQLHQYKCSQCGKTFEAGDRRRYKRGATGTPASKTTKAKPH